MERNQMMTEIMGLYDELQKLKEENERLRKCVAATEEAEPKEMPPVIKIMKKKYFMEKFSYALRAMGLKDEEKTNLSFGFSHWLSRLTVDNMMGYNKELLEVASFNEIKEFFRDELSELFWEMRNQKEEK